MKISIIIPVYNGQDFIVQAISSALTQEQTDEVVVINDGSTDNSESLVKEMALADPRIRLITHPDNLQKGRGASRNLGIQKSRSTWIAFLDADDYYLEGRFDHLKGRVRPEIDGFYDPIETRFEDPTLESVFPEKKTGIFKDIHPSRLFDFLIAQSEQRISLNGLIVRRSKLEEVGGFDENLMLGEDSDFILRLSKKACLIAGSLTTPIAVRRVHARNSFHDKNAVATWRHRFYRKWLFGEELAVEAKHQLLIKYLSTSPGARRFESFPWLYRCIKAGHFLAYKLGVQL